MSRHWSHLYFISAGSRSELIIMAGSSGKVLSGKILLETIFYNVLRFTQFNSISLNLSFLCIILVWIGPEAKKAIVFKAGNKTQFRRSFGSSRSEILDTAILSAWIWTGSCFSGVYHGEMLWSDAFKEIKKIIYVSQLK